MSIISYIVLLASLIAAFLAVYSIRYRRSDGAVSFCLLMFAAAVYSFGYAFEIASRTANDVSFWLNVEYTGISFIPTLWLLFAMQYTNRKKWLRPVVVIPMIIISLTTLLLHLTNDQHHLFYHGFTLNFIDSLTLAAIDRGGWYWIHIGYFNVTIVLGTYLFIKMLVIKPKPYRAQSWIMVAGSLVPWITNTIYIAGYSPYGIDLNPFATAVTGILFAIGIFQYGILQFVPIALENVFGSMNDGVILIDTERRIVDFNNSAKMVLKSLTEVSIGRSFCEVVPAPSELADLIDSGAESPVNFEMEAGKGKEFYKASISSIADKRKKLYGKAIILSNITHQKNYEQKLIELNASKDKFFSILAHDLRNPFAAYKMSLEFLTSQYNDLSDKEIIDFLNILHEGSRNIYDLLEDLLQWSRLQRGTIEYFPEVISVCTVVNNTFSLLKTNAVNKRIELINNTPSNVLCFADLNMASAIVRNLVSNAIKFTREGGSVTVTAGTETGSRFTIITVRDTGIGIAPETLAKLFRIDLNYTEPGTDNEKGTGLGLILCKEFVEKHGGTISVESEPNAGSTFTFSLPAYSLH